MLQYAVGGTTGGVEFIFCCFHTQMAGNAFAFWLEKDQVATGAAATASVAVKRDSRSRGSSKSHTYPRREQEEESSGDNKASSSVSGGGVTTRPQIDPSELFRPLRAPTRASRPQSCSSYSSTCVNTPASLEPINTSTTSSTFPGVTQGRRAGEGERGVEEGDGSRSAPSTIQSSSSRRWWNRPTRHQSMSAGPPQSFVSYLDGPIRSNTQRQVCMRSVMYYVPMVTLFYL